jgi:hypothetical protein
VGQVDFKLDDAELRGNLAKFGPAVNKYITLTMDQGGQAGVREMKMKAPWTDRTTNARTGLHTKVSHKGTGPIGFKEHEIIFSHAMHYGIWLELRGYDIIMPTVLAVGREVMKTLKDLFRDLEGMPTVSPHVDAPNPPPSKSSKGARQRAEKAYAASKSPKTGTTRRTRRS